ncbi:MAG: hypothetical protein M1821_009476 [Bathelium mastoideum]|nr:MAG: hypothetical protein M1821_009476 [Bathelium mastoideum]
MATVNTRLLILSDTHGFQFDDNADRDFRPQLPRIDVLLHCGDLTQCGGVPSFKKALRMLGSIDAELKLVIPGNHDLELDRQYWSTHLDEGDTVEEHDEALELWTGEMAKSANVVFLNEGLHTFQLKNGAKFTLYASPYSPEFCDWAFPYEHNLDRFNMSEDINAAAGVTSIAQNPVPDYPGVDIMMTHGPPKNILDGCPDGNQGCENLLRAVTRAKPRLHCFGHIHEGYGARIVTWQRNSPFTMREASQDVCAGAGHQRLTREANCEEKGSIEFGKETIMINAAIMTGKYEPDNLPWVVNLQLPSA